MLHVAIACPWLNWRELAETALQWNRVEWQGGGHCNNNPLAFNLTCACASISWWCYNLHDSVIGLAELFGVSLNIWTQQGLGPRLEPSMGSLWGLHSHSSFGMAMGCPVRSQDNHMDAKNVYKLIPMRFRGKSCTSQLIGECSFPLFRNPILHKFTKKPCSIRYAKNGQFR